MRFWLGGVRHFRGCLRGGGKMLFVMWFQDELSAFRKMSAEGEAMRFASAFGA